MPPTIQEVTTMQYLVLLTYRPGEGPEEGTLGASGLKVDAATTVRAPGGELTVTDGPFAETKETFFSFYMLELEDLDAAIAWAAKMPAAEYGSVDIRPMVGLELR
jgi:hypothetical protein